MKRITVNNIYNTYLLFCVLLIFVGLFIPYGFPLFSYCVIILAFLFPYKLVKISLSKSFIIIYMFSSFLYLFALMMTEELLSNNYSALINLIIVFLLFSLLSVVTRDIKKDFYKHLFFCLFVLGGFVALLGILKFFLLTIDVKIPFFKTEDGKYPWGTSLITDYNVFGRGLLLSLISGFFQYNEKSSKKLYAVLFVTIVIGLILTGSRSSILFLVLLVSIILINIAFKNLSRNPYKIILKKSKYQILLYVALITIVMITVLYFFAESLNYTKKLSTIFYRLGTIKNVSFGLEEGNAFNSRLLRWKLSINIFSTYSPIEKIFGSGFDYLQVFGTHFSSESGYNYPHNLFLSVLLSNGLLGLVAYISFILIIYSVVLNSRHKKEIYYFFLMSLLFTSISGDQLFDSKYLIFIFYLPLFSIK